MSLIDQDFGDKVGLFIGPWLIGGWFEILLQGVLFCQFVSYFRSYRDDKGGLQLAVAVLAVLTTLKSCDVFAVIWHNFVVLFGDLPSAVLLNFSTAAWWQTGSTLMGATIDILVQAYFCFRLYVISKKWYVVAPAAALCVFSYIAAIISMYYIATAPGGLTSGLWIEIHFGTACAADILISVSTAFFLIRSKKAIHQQTAGLIDSLIRLTFQTGAPASLCALLNVILLGLAQPTLSIIFNVPLPKLYAISMMWTLNARRAMRAQRSGTRSGTYTGSSSNDLSARSRPQRRGPNGDIELGAIQVFTQTETTKHANDGDVFPLQGDNGSKSQFAHHQGGRR
ncbi:hypothetical protein C8J57DRAFT_709572 [Mycena rebaudengoi]|nr:hypothetical protein C8J57DRAFT_709572 [Mycena rebaudengoi]